MRLSPLSLPCLELVPDTFSGPSGTVAIVLRAQRTLAKVYGSTCQRAMHDPVKWTAESHDPPTSQSAKLHAYDVFHTPSFLLSTSAGLPHPFLIYSWRLRLFHVISIPVASPDPCPTSSVPIPGRTRPIGSANTTAQRMPPKPRGAPQINTPLSRNKEPPP